MTGWFGARVWPGRAPDGQGGIVAGSGPRRRAGAAGGVPRAMAEPRALWAAWARVAAGSGMPGADGLSVADFARELGPRLDRLADQLAEGGYAPQPLRLVTITRGGRRRALGLPTVRDRVAQRAFLDVCHEQLDADAVEVSFAYRRGRSWLDALAAAERHRDAGRRVVLRTDIADYFARIRHDLLLAALAPAVPADGVELVRGWITAPVLTERGIVARREGVPEGAPVSPALANVYLRSFDAAVHRRPGFLVRYADDIAVFCADTEQAVQSAHVAGGALAALDLAMNQEKTYVSSFDRGFSFLGWVFFQDGGWEAEPSAGWTHPMSVGRGRAAAAPDPRAYTGPPPRGRSPAAPRAAHAPSASWRSP
ncbi:reverse transcriptase domain-containing protein [Pseudofrankia sp. BMG5.37]|uniref:reverse transcriptase domain-containing protein n=1 Tax=Pseudofrankia sp. BMG5.37 TaxID=3050035 RepID=UPI0028949273|nr:reverse transcriptase domain-containing protein [Pseudofrankia sp. BMG5.37]MDT3440464.1 reverse transcriptase domain-containing protein [Pseudofrankia sp. BMG5.37]